MSTPPKKKHANNFSVNLNLLANIQNEYDLMQNIHLFYWYEEYKEKYINGVLNNKVSEKLYECNLFRDYLYKLVNDWINEVTYANVVKCLIEAENITSIERHSVYNKRPIGQFLHMQNLDHELQLLTEYKMNILKSSSVWNQYIWKSYNVMFNQYLREVCRFETKNKLLYDSFSNGLDIGAFIGAQKDNYLFDNMTQKQMNQLTLCESFDQFIRMHITYRKDFLQKIQLLINVEKHINILPTTVVQKIHIGVFMEYCKILYKNNRLPFYKKNVLYQSYSWRSWLVNQSISQHELFLIRLHILLEAEKTCKNISHGIMCEGIDIYSWTYKQKIKLNCGKLPDNHLELLNFSSTWKNILDTSEQTSNSNKSV